MTFSTWFNNKLFLLLIILLTSLSAGSVFAKPKQYIVVAIDAGHGGKDPGAIGQGGHYEKNVTLSVAKKLEALLKKDPLLKPVMTRHNDVYISVAERSNVARKHKANLLISIHADAAPNKAIRGASIWVLSTGRADSEMGRLLEQHEKQSELLGGAGEALSGSENNPYLSQAVIDLQFAHSQQVGYTVATYLIKELKKVGFMHKTEPEHASLGVLRSPDIPSVLVELGFISNKQEERLLISDAYQNKLAKALYLGIKQYFKMYPVNFEHS